MSDAYVFGRDARASMRLDFQHHLMKDIIGFLLHPDISLKHSSGNKPLKIADVATGTGVWAIDLACHADLPPGTEITGLDVSDGQFPPPGNLPVNVRLFGGFDMLQPVPSHLQGVFDIVHVRLVVCVLQHNDPVPALNNLKKMLKPGGYLQWVEASLSKHRATVPPNCKASGDGMDASGKNTLRCLMEPTKNPEDPFAWIDRLGEYFADHDLINAGLFQYYGPPRTWLPWGINQLFGRTEAAEKLEADGHHEKARTIREQMIAAEREYREGVGIRAVLAVAIGQKTPEEASHGDVGYSTVSAVENGVA